MQDSDLSRAAVPSASSGFATPVVGQARKRNRRSPTVARSADAQTVAVRHHVRSIVSERANIETTSDCPEPFRSVLFILVMALQFEPGGCFHHSDDWAFGQTGGKIRVVGHSSMGANTSSASRQEEVNLGMSLRRANAVADELIEHGVPRQSVGNRRGDRAPAYEESSRTGAAYNRRTEIFIDY